MEIKTTENTGNLTPEQIVAQEQEAKKAQDQEAAFKRISEENKKFKEKEAAEVKAKEEKEQLEANEKAKKEDPVKFDRDQLKKELREELRSDSEKDAKLSQVLEQYPQLSEHKDKIEKYLNDDSRKGIPVDEVVAGAVGIGALLKVGASIGSEALEQAENSQNGGGNAAIETKTEEQKTAQRHTDSLPKGFR